MKPQELGGLIGKTGFEVLEQRRFGVIEFVVARRE
jgi:hypothetical protein